eukprot:TRINITY_DN24085_c0_g1_i10.p1 TRINITY_DN24085_c0_g1~~TRINITY_DN24085_c0_g1_i10.p1  ORF type:complete len:212 (-),score=23.00 TRINITY_DN24085_c0_g1_i10:522-1157(-)
MNGNNNNFDNQYEAADQNQVNHNSTEQNSIFKNCKQKREQEENEFTYKSDPRKRKLLSFLESYFWNALLQTQIDTQQQQKQQQSETISRLKEQLKQNEELRDFSSLEYKFIMEEKRALETQLQQNNAEVQKYRENNCEDKYEVLRGHCERYRMQRNQVAENLQKAEAELDKVTNGYINLKNQVRKVIQSKGNNDQGILNSQDYELLKKLVS